MLVFDRTPVGFQAGQAALTSNVLEYPAQTDFLSTSSNKHLPEPTVAKPEPENDRLSHVGACNGEGNINTKQCPGHGPLVLWPKSDTEYVVRHHLCSKSSFCLVFLYDNCPIVYTVYPRSDEMTTAMSNL